jgi:hypothetical protein
MNASFMAVPDLEIAATTVLASWKDTLIRHATRSLKARDKMTFARLRNTELTRQKLPRNPRHIR